jgi:hypothetical protein
MPQYRSLYCASSLGPLQVHSKSSEHEALERLTETLQPERRGIVKILHCVIAQGSLSWWVNAVERVGVVSAYTEKFDLRKVAAYPRGNKMRLLDRALLFSALKHA